MKEILLSVALPMYSAQSIAWLAMESLCRQECDFEWELLIAEETYPGSNFFGFANVVSYKERLEKAGCKRISYIPLNSKITLAQKWYLLSKEVSETSFGMLLQAADCYSPRLRLQISYNGFSLGNDWVQCRRGYFYNIPNKAWAMFDADTTLFYHPCSLNMGIAKKLLHKIYPETRINSSIDSWLYKFTNPQSVYYVSPSLFEDGIDSDGCNNISKNRENLIIGLQPPFVETGYRGQNVDKDIMARLEGMQSKNRDKYPDITIGIVATRTDMYERAITSVNAQIYPGKVFLKILNNFDKRLSIGAAFNRLVEQCKTPYITFLGDDDYIQPDYIAALIARRYIDTQETDSAVGYTCYLTLWNEEKSMIYEAAAPGLWETAYLLENKFDESLEKYVTASHYEEVVKRGDTIALADWYFGYMYYQHSGNTSGNKFEEEEKKIHPLINTNEHELREEVDSCLRRNEEKREK